jgi:DNA-binding response OmpR family regulator
MKLQNKAGRPLNFLVVDDDNLASIELECLLEDLGHSVAAVAVSTPCAIRLLDEREGEIDAVIFGATLIGLPPFALARKLARTDLPVVVTSAHSEEFVRVLGFTAPYLPKPFRQAEVARIVDALNHREVATAA